ncbi:MAG: phosphatidylserine/phosphatidylglycerophosphate/cardiolipin synthase family protein, partial [Candidatus Sericytochromatia bacterium]|nr:phosphatidylserine/phosphatidylglycerophosphate/cardiolipin synthase family protein [Candidatus Tanganyikabacteria bacterium]
MHFRKFLAIAALATGCTGVLAGCSGSPVQQVPALTGALTPLPAESLARARASQAALAPAMASPTTWNNRIALYLDRAAEPALHEMLDSARKSVWIETFELHDDPAGMRIIDRLVDKHRSGLAVRVILDEIGNRAVRSGAVRKLRDAGIPVVYYGPFPYVGKDGPGLNITHRKLYLVDGDRAMTGGMNLGEKYLARAHDMLWKVEGDAAAALHAEFGAEWRRAGGKAPVEAPAKPAGLFGTEPVGLAVTSPREKGREDEIRKVIGAAIDGAKSRIDMAYPFFWDDALLDKLAAAEARGVQVRVILTRHGNSAMTKLNLRSAAQLMPRGVEFHWYEKSYAHIKYCVVDEAFLAIGSSNADTLTFENNQELDLILTNPLTVADFRAKVPDADWQATAPV